MKSSVSRADREGERSAVRRVPHRAQRHFPSPYQTPLRAWAKVFVQTVRVSLVCEEARHCRTAGTRGAVRRMSHSGGSSPKKIDDCKALPVFLTAREVADMLNVDERT